jgi:predicted secreted protein
MKRYFTYTGKKQWLWALPQIINGYNNTKHRGIKRRRPIDLYATATANTPLDHSVWLEQEEEEPKKKQQQQHHSISDYVRVSHVKGPFLKNFDENWSEEVFRIVGIDTRQIPTMYIIEDLNGDVIKGKFYHKELQKVERPDIFRIENIIQTKGQGKYKQYYVKWVGYPKQYNSWIRASDIVKPT